MATKSISQLDTAATLDNGDLFETAIPDSGSASGYASKKMSLAQLADYSANDVVYPALLTAAKSLVGAINEARGVSLTGTLVAGNTTITLSDNVITASSIFDIYTDTYGINPTAVSVSVGSITLTFAEQAADVGVLVFVK